ncbi:hypothetical protein B0H13DRAFT_896873 [Mycena leptocephala]|nr:hypothetical protein B0H13DRAFT_896873 [Mycena leptocephala]
MSAPLHDIAASSSCVTSRSTVRFGTLSARFSLMPCLLYTFSSPRTLVKISLSLLLLSLHSALLWGPRARFSRPSREPLALGAALWLGCFGSLSSDPWWPLCTGSAPPAFRSVPIRSSPLPCLQPGKSRSARTAEPPAYTTKLVVTLLPVASHPTLTNPSTST